MPRPKQQHLKQRKDGRYCCKYHGEQFLARTEKEAFALRDEYIRQEQQKEYNRENPIVRIYAESWLENKGTRARAKSIQNNKIHIRHLTDTIGDLELREIRPSDIKSIYAQKYADASQSYIKHARAIYIALFAAAVDDGIIHTNPAKAASAQPHSGPEGHHRAITQEKRELIDTVALDLPASRVARVMLYSGLRPQEVKALRTEDIDRENGVIHVRRSVHKAAANRYEVDEIGKTVYSIRDVPLMPPVEAALEGITGYVISNHGELVTPSVWDNEWAVWRNAIERHMNGMQRRWYGRTREHKALLAAGKPLPPWRSFDVTPYSLRHSFATWCRDYNVELHTCIDWMGHADAAMIMRIYDDPTSRSRSEAEKLRKAAFSDADRYAK